MFDFAAARRMMVDGQVRTADVTDLRLIAAMSELPRERFVPDNKAELAYLDLDLPAGEGEGGVARCLLKPMVLAKLIQMADIAEDDRVLDVGCASGYSSALLAQLAGSVVALEESRSLARMAERALAGFPNAKVVVGPLVAGWPAAGPYDVILMQGASDIVPDALLRQLKDGGRLACILGPGPQRKAMLYRKADADNDVSGRPMFDAAAPLLPGFNRSPTFVF
jgi:protein-L-isoaspartate(D-aspartate) O-methyltransferase